MADNSKELKITISAAADASVAAVEQRLLKGYRDVKNQLQPIPLQLTAAFRQEAVLQAAESLRSQMQRVADRQAIRFVAEIDSRQARHIALGLGSGGAQNFGGPRPYGEQIQGSPESYREFERNARTQLLGVFRQNLATTGTGRESALHLSGLEDDRIKLIEQQNRAEAQTLAAIRAGAATEASLLGVRQEHARQLKLLDDAIVVAMQEQAQAARDTASARSDTKNAILSQIVKEQGGGTARKEQFEQAKATIFPQLIDEHQQAAQLATMKRVEPIRQVSRTEEEQASRDAQASLIRSMRATAVSYTRLENEIAAEVAARVAAFGESEAEARNVVKAEERLAIATNQAAAARAGGAGGEGYGGLGQAFGGIRALFGRYSPVAQAIQFARGSGPLLAFGLAAHEAAQLASASEKAATAIRSGAKSQGEANDEFTRSIPLVGSFYSAIEDAREALTGEKAEIERINKLLDYQNEGRKRAAEQLGEGLRQVQAIRQETAKVGLAGPKLSLEDIRQQRQSAIEGATQQAATQTAGIDAAEDKRRQDRIQQIRAGFARITELSERNTRSQELISIFEQNAKEHPGNAAFETEQANRERAVLVGRQREIEKIGRQINSIEKDAADERLRIESIKQQIISATMERAEEKRFELLRQYHQQTLAEERESADKILKIQSELAQQQIRIQAQVAANANRAQQDKAKYEGRGLDVIGLEAKGQREAIESARQEQTAKTREDIRAKASSLGQDIGKNLPDLLRGFDLGGTTNKIDLKQVFTGLLPFPELKQEFRKPDLGYDAEHLRNVANRVKTWWGEMLGINVKGQLDQKEVDVKAKADADHVRDEELRRIRDDAREVRDERFRHDQDMNRINAETTSNRLRLMGLDYQAEAVQRRAALADRINELRHAAQLEIEQHKERQPEIEKRLGESERGEVEKFKSERSLDILGEIQRMRQSASLPQTTEARFLTQVPGFAHAKLEADLIVDAQHRMQDVLHQDLVEISRKIGGPAATDIQTPAPDGAISQMRNEAALRGTIGQDIIAPVSSSVSQPIARGVSHQEYSTARHTMYQERNREINTESRVDAQIRRSGDAGVRLAMSTANRPQAGHDGVAALHVKTDKTNTLLEQILKAIPNLTVPARAYPEGSR